MARVTIYLPDEVHRRAKASGLKLSPVCRRAIMAALSVADTEPEGAEVMDEVWQWLDRGRKLIEQLQDFLA
jgi:post-segregation antitoxin (ccd killing protein)